MTRLEALGFALLALAVLIWVGWIVAAMFFVYPLFMPLWPLLASVPIYLVGLGLVFFG